MRLAPSSSSITWSPPSRNVPVLTPGSMKVAGVMTVHATPLPRWPRNTARASTCACEMGLHSDGIRAVSISSFPGATSRLPAPPTMTTRLPVSRPASTRAAAATLSSDRSLHDAMALATMSWSRAAAVTCRESVTSPRTMARLACSPPMRSGWRTTAATRWPRARASSAMRLPMLPEAPKRAMRRWRGALGVRDLGLDAMLAAGQAVLRSINPMLGAKADEQREASGFE